MNIKNVSKPEEIKPKYNFERDSGIRFEHASVSKYMPITPKKGYLTVIPSLESVNADEYNKKMEKILSGQEQMPGTEELIPEEIQPVEDVPVKTTSVISEKAKPVTKKVNRKKVKQEDKIEFYSEDSEDNTLDPFAPGSGEIPLKDLEVRPNEGIGTKLKKSFGKLFTAAEDEE